MRLALLSSEDSAFDISKELRAFLEKEIVNVEVEEVRLPHMLDIPVWVKDNPGCDLYFVFVVYKRPKVEVKVLLEKLVSLEMEEKPRILKAVSKLAEDWDKDELVAKWSKKLLRALFGAEADPPTKKELEDEAEAEEDADDEEERRGKGFRLF